MPNHPMKKISKSVTINGRRTSISMEAAHWAALSKIAEHFKIKERYLLSAIDQIKTDDGLTACIRVFIVIMLVHPAFNDEYTDPEFSYQMGALPKPISSVLLSID